MMRRVILIVVYISDMLFELENMPPVGVINERK
jgi:hypothetical protein